jgi:hypothetical protein
MSEVTFSAHVRHQTGLAIIYLAGEINTFAEAQLNSAYSEAETHDPALIVLGFK